MDLRKHVGTLIMVIAAAHVVLGLAFFGGWLSDILRAGVGNLNWTLEALASYWFIIFAWPLFLLGYMVEWAYRRTGRMPTMLGPWLIGVAVVGVLFLPAQGLWLFIPVGLLASAEARRSDAATRGRSA